MVTAITLMLSHELSDVNFRVVSVMPGHTATALNNFTGARTVEEEAASIVSAATDNKGTGKFFKDGGEARW